MSRSTIFNLMAGVAFAALVSGPAAWAQTATEQTEELQQQQQQVTPPAGEQAPAPEAPATEPPAPEGQVTEQPPAAEEPDAQVTEEAPAAEQPEEQATEEPPAEAPQEGVTEAPEAETPDAPEQAQEQQQQQEQTQETTVNVDITTEQETVIRQTVLEHDIQPVSVDFDVTVGAVITSPAVALHPVPVGIIDVVPAFRGHLHFVLADERIVIVDPCTLRIVTIIA